MLTRYASLAAFLALVVAASVVAGSFEAGEWYYHKLTRPGWTPPGWLFGAAWSVLHVLAALAAWQIWLSGHPARRRALAWWALLQLLNVGWAVLFFGIHRIGWAWFELGLAIVAAALCIHRFHQLSQQAAYLMVPYLLGLVFACVLNFAMWTLNGGSLTRLLP